MTRRRQILASLSASIALVAAIAWLVLRSHDAAPSFANEPISATVEDVPIVRELQASPEAVVTPPVLAERDRERAMEPVDRAAVRASSSLLLFGFVRPPVGQTTPPGEISVALITRLGERQSARAGADGAYSFSGLTVGHYWLVAGSFAGDAAHVQVELDGRVEETRLDLQLVPPPGVLVKVVDREGHSFLGAGVTAIATREPPDEWFDRIVASLNSPFSVGYFRFNDQVSEKLPDGYLGKFELEIEPPVYVSLVRGERVLMTKRVERGATEVDFMLERESPLLRLASLRFRCVDAKTRATVEVREVSLEGNSSRFVKGATEVQRVEMLMPGRYRIRVSAHGYESLERDVLVQAGEDMDLGDIQLQHEQWISGNIIDDDGHVCVMELRCDEYTESGPVPALGSIAVVQSKSDGSFRISGLSRKRYLVRTSSRAVTPFAQWSRVIDATRGPVENLRIQLVRGVPLVVRPSDPSNWNTVGFKIIDDSGLAVKTTRLWSAEPSPISLAPGSYIVEVRASENAEPKRIPITIVSQPVELALP